MVDKKDILYFDEDDSSELGANGKQVFVTKRINGKTTHNKIDEGQKNELYNNSNKKDEELYIEFKTPYHQNNNTTKKKKRKTQKTKNQKSNSTKKYNQKKAKKKKRTKRLIKLFILIILIVGATIFALVSPIFNIEKITVQGNEKVDTQTVISLSGLQVGNNIFKNVKSNVIENIKENPYINNVQIKRSLPGTIEISVEERTVAYQIKVIDSYVYVDYQGYILEVSSTKTKVPILEGMKTSQDDILNQKRLSNDDIGILNTILKIMESAENINIDSLITKITIENGREYILYLSSEKKHVYLGDGSNITNKMLYVEMMLKEEKGKSGKMIINGDLNDGFKPYFREEKLKKEE